MADEQKQTNVNDKRFTPKQIAEWFKISTESLRNWERAGKIPPAVRTLGGHRRYTIEHVNKLASLMGEPVPQEALA